MVASYNSLESVADLHNTEAVQSGKSKSRQMVRVDRTDRYGTIITKYINKSKGVYFF